MMTDDELGRMARAGGEAGSAYMKALEDSIHRHPAGKKRPIDPHLFTPLSGAPDVCAVCARDPRMCAVTYRPRLAPSGLVELPDGSFITRDDALGEPFRHVGFITKDGIRTERLADDSDIPPWGNGRLRAEQDAMEVNMRITGEARDTLFRVLGIPLEKPTLRSRIWSRAWWMWRKATPWRNTAKRAKR